MTTLVANGASRIKHAASRHRFLLYSIATCEHMSSEGRSGQVLEGNTMWMRSADPTSLMAQLK